MAASAYILIDIPPGRDMQRILDSLRNLESVKVANAVAGPHDIIAELEAEDFNVLAQSVIGEVRSIDGISDTVTLYVVADN